MEKNYNKYKIDASKSANKINDLKKQLESKNKENEKLQKEIN